MLKNLFFALLIWVHIKPAVAYTIYLTFDDGPLGGTENIIQVLEEEEVPATFFMVGIHLERCKDCQPLIRQIRKSQYVFLGNHSYSHAFGHYTSFYKDAKGVMADMVKNNKVLGLKGLHTVYSRLPGRNVFRLPGLYYNDPYISDKKNSYERNASDEVFNEGFYIFGWDHEWESKANGMPAQSVNKLLEEIEECLENSKTMSDDELILLMHDQMFRKAEARGQLRELIIRLRDKGYNFAIITDYTPALSNIEGFTNDIS